MKPKLTNKQAKFIEEYLVDFNAANAATKAGYSKKTARSAGQRLLTNVAIKAAINKAKKKATEKVELTVESILKNIAIMFDMAKEDKNYGGMGKALEMQAKFKKMLTDRTEIEVPEGVTITINGA